MPGLFGYTDNDGLSRDDRILNGMRDLLIYAGGGSSEPFYHADGVHAGYCAPSFEAVDQHITAVDGVACWLDGEIYNVDELGGNQALLSLSSPPLSSTKVSSTGISSSHKIKGMMISAYRSGVLMDFLRKADGYFSAVIHDSKNRQIKFITDRFGFRHLAYSVHNGRIVWATECKAFLAVPGFRVAAEGQSVDDFMKYGVLCDNLTLLDGVRLVDAAAVLTFDMAFGEVRIEHYRFPEEIRPLTGKNSLPELYEEWGRLFKRSVARRTVYTDAERTGLTLSGGLDSRAILAAMPEPLDGGINAVTFGTGGCDDIRFASAVARLKGANHHVFHLDVDGWLEGTFFGIWAVDGAVEISSLQGIRHLSELSRIFGICMNGIGGGTLQGGRALGSSLFLEHGRTASGAPGLQMVRRRFTRPGFRPDELYFKVRMPFFDSDLYDFVMALPEDVRRTRMFYRGALLHNFPEYYMNIPWQQAGVPISLPPSVFDARFFCNRVLCRAKRKLQGWGLPFSDTKLFFDTPAALRQKGNRALAEKILNDPNAVWPDYISCSADSLLNAGTKRLCRVLTFEVWMRLLNDTGFRKRYITLG